MKDYPDLEIWSHQVFKEPDWPAFAQLVRDAEAVVEERRTYGFVKLYLLWRKK